MSDVLLPHFIAEARELVQAASDGLLALDRAPQDRAPVDGVFRALHTLKGSVGLFDFGPLSLVLHAAEDAMGALRDGSAGRPTCDALLACTGVVENWIETIDRTGGLPADAPGVASGLVQALHAGGATAPPPPQAAVGAPPDWLAPLLAGAPGQRAFEANERLTALRYVPAPDSFYRGDDPLALIRAIPDLRALHIEPRTPWPDGQTDPFACNMVIDCLSAAPAAEIARVLRFVRDQVVLAEVPPQAGAEGPVAAVAEPEMAGSLRTWRVDAARVDALAGIAGELVIAKNALVHLGAGAAALSPAFARALAGARADIERLTGDLDRAVTRLRSVRLDETFRRLPLVARQTAGRLGKQMRLDISGADIEADKAVVDALYEPLLHLLRNAIDHGIETVAARQAAGKPEVGLIRLAAARVGERIVVTLADDGAGIDAARVLASAVAGGRISATDAAGMGDEAAFDLLFAAGFSTAGSVTDISGRGVGLDAVRRAIETLGGEVRLRSTPGAGSSFQLAVPIAAAVTAIVTVRAGGESFGVPFHDVAETIRLGRGEITPLRQGAAFTLRGRTVPLLSLARLLGLPADAAGAVARVLIIAAGEQLVGLEVAAFAARMDVVLRPMDGLLAGMGGMLGTALLGDGRVLLVLDPASLVEQAVLT